MTHRPTLIIGNWKMNKTIAEAESFLSSLSLSIKQCTSEVGLAVPFTMISVANKAVSGTKIRIGAQNVSSYEQGAYTGEISCAMLKDAGASFTLIGHSERRRHFHEDDKIVNAKILRCLEWSIQPIVCVGETSEEHQAGMTHEVLERQIINGMRGLTQDQIKGLVLAYEPVWAIGTNQAATPDIVEKTHAFCRSVLAKKWGNPAAEKVLIQYGGSVTAANAADLLNQPDVDGLLVGGASLTWESFSKILLARN